MFISLKTITVMTFSINRKTLIQFFITILSKFKPVNFTFSINIYHYNYELLDLAAPWLTVINPLRTKFILLLQNSSIKTMYLIGRRRDESALWWKKRTPHLFSTWIHFFSWLGKAWHILISNNLTQKEDIRWSKENLYLW